MQARLSIVEGARPGRFRLKLPTVIGRSHDAVLKVRQAHVSRRHCEVFAEDGVLIVRDLGSSNGTFVNGRRIAGRTLLAPGDQLRVGNIVLRAEYEAPEIIPLQDERGTSEGQSTTLRAAAEDRLAVFDHPAPGNTPAVSSVVNYRESEDGSFLGIQAIGGEGTPHVAAEEFAQQFHLQLEEPATRSVDAGDSKLTDFLKKLE